MFIITNRKIRSGKRDFDLLGKTPNAKGPNELRIVEATRQGGQWRLEALPDTLTREQKRALDLPLSKPAYASQYMAHKVLTRVREDKKNVLFFVHGFNNDVEAVIERAQGLEEHYGVEVVAFSWPANGGGVQGVASYKSDKRDARASTGAVYRAMAKARGYLDDLNEHSLATIRAKAAEKFPNNYEQQHAYVTKLSEQYCPFNISLLLHSMGCYLFKQIQSSSTFDAHHMLFDNVILAAADANNADHAHWVDRIACRRRVYITINEDDSALRVSRIKSGEEQRARLGHYLHRLDSQQAYYVDVTDAPQVGNSHAYFEGDPVKRKTGSLYKFFHAALNGERAEENLSYHPPTHTWRP